MQLDKIREARAAAKHFYERSGEVIEQATRGKPDAKFIMADGNHAKILKKASNWLKGALEDMRRP